MSTSLYTRVDPEEVGVSSAALGNIDALQERFLAQNAYQGSVVLVARHGKVCYLKAFGKADEDVPMATDSIFRLASMSKVVAAAAVMQLHLKVMLDEIALAARRIQRHCTTLNTVLYSVTEHSEAQHDRVYAAIRALDAAVAETSDLSERAERLLHLASAEGAAPALADETRELATATRLVTASAAMSDVSGASYCRW